MSASNVAAERTVKLKATTRQVDEFLASPVSRNEPMLMGSPAAPTVTAYSLKFEKVFCDGVLAIMQIAANKLFRFAEPHSFTGLEPYFRTRFSLSRAQVYRYLNCAAVISDLICAPQHMASMLRPLPLRQRVAKAVKDLAPCSTSRQQLWAAVLAQQPAGLDITSTDVHRVAALLEQQATAEYPSPPSEPFHDMEDADDHSDFEMYDHSGTDRMKASRLGSSADGSQETQLLYPIPLMATQVDDNTIPLVYPSPDISHASRHTYRLESSNLNSRSDEIVSPLQCLAQVALDDSAYDHSSMTSVSSSVSHPTPLALNSEWPVSPNKLNRYSSTHARISHFREPIVSLLPSGTSRTSSGCRVA
ncbi:hypothetical protein BCR44DRAFT_1501523 [Catenaria anguillulae PL171]|uniref:Uncharacterized protein n=1 Tax=Catenaria anguillulae PL171 TaxID=765915 RepID=A0A1Y2HG95_9FUNG|nr:hypothetical protein BCR44DRAFT_1501523 [Catenaria anguillulae PL171]